MSSEIGSEEASLVITNLPDTACFTTFGDLLRALPDFLKVVIPTNITNVVVSKTQPLDTQRDNVWFRFSNGGVFMGIYLFSEGTWRQFFPAPNAIYQVAGDSRDPPAGYILASDANFLSSTQIAHLQAFWLLDPTGNFYTLFDVVPAPT